MGTQAARDYTFDKWPTSPLSWLEPGGNYSWICAQAEDCAWGGAKGYTGHTCGVMREAERGGVENLEERALTEKMIDKKGMTCKLLWSNYYRKIIQDMKIIHKSPDQIPKAESNHLSLSIFRLLATHLFFFAITILPIPPPLLPFSQAQLLHPSPAFFLSHDFAVLLALQFFFGCNDRVCAQLSISPEAERQYRRNASPGGTPAGLGTAVESGIRRWSFS